MTTNTLIQVKGIADIICGLILTIRPQFVYDTPIMHKLHSLSGLHLTNAATAPGFNQAIACMVAAIGVGHVVASRAGPAVEPTIFAMNLAWSVFGFLVCASPVEKGLGSSTLLMTSITHAVFSGVFLYLYGGNMCKGHVEKKEKKED